MSAFSPGMRLHDRYLLVERIGAGGMSEVWRATDELLERAVAVKVLASALATDPRLRELIWREARAAARLSHPHVTQVHDYGEAPLPDGRRTGFLVMELVEGQTIAARLAAGPLPWPEAAQVVRQVAAALAAAHRIGVVHRDVKPGNVMLTGDGAKVLDFGIAAALSVGVAEGPDTDPGRLLGTPGYAAPERRDATAPAQAGSDVYSLGVLLYEALTGQRPDHQADAAAAPPLPTVPEAVPEVVTRLCQACLSPDPVHRPAAAQVATTLAEAAGQADPLAATVVPPRPAATTPSPTRIDPESGAQQDQRWWRRYGPARAVAVLGGVVLAGLVVAVLAVLAVLLRPGDQAAPVEGGPGAAGAPTGPATSAGAGEPTSGTEGSATTAPAPESPEQVVAELERALLDAREDQAITQDGFEDLRDEVDDLREALAEDDPANRDDQLRAEAEELRGEIADVRADQEVDQPTADRLTGLLEPLLAP